jgi:hypothetical protein
MIGFQIFTFIVLLMFLVVFFRLMRHPRHYLSWPTSLLTLVIICLIAAVFFDPNLAVIIAKWCGIGRGADLMIYLSILFLLLNAFTFLIRLKRADQKMIELAREIALMKVEDQERNS